MPLPPAQLCHATPPRGQISTLGVLGGAVVFFIIIPSQLALNHPWQLAIFAGIGTYVMFAATLVLMIRQVVFRVPGVVLCIWAGLLLAATLSFWATDSSRALLVYGSLFFVFVTTALLARKCADLDLLVLVIVVGASLSGLMIGLMGLAVEPFSLRRYQGAFNNPNSMGWFAGGLIHMIAGALYGYGRYMHSRTRWFLLSALGIFFILLLASNSRAALASVLAVIAVLTLLRLKQAVNLRRMTLHRRAFLSVLALVSTTVFVGAISFALGWLDGVVEKTIITAAAGDITQSRAGAWIASLQHWTWFGLGQGYAEDIGREGLASGHSTWISHLSRYGAVGVTLFMGLLIYIALWAWRHALRQCTPGAFVLLTSIVGFMTNATFETGTSTPGLLLSLVVFAILLQRQVRMGVTAGTAKQVLDC